VCVASFVGFRFEGGSAGRGEQHMQHIRTTTPSSVCCFINNAQPTATAAVDSQEAGGDRRPRHGPAIRHRAWRHGAWRGGVGRCKLGNGVTDASQVIKQAVAGWRQVIGGKSNGACARACPPPAVAPLAQTIPALLLRQPLFFFNPLSLHIGVRQEPRCSKSVTWNP
jgi:hypothetical protein